MPNAYRGIPGNLSSNFPGTINITSSTYATPIVITTSTSHGLITGDIVIVYNHQTNVAANGQFTITVLSSNTFSLNGSANTGGSAGGATGVVQPLTAPSFNQPSDGDGRNAASVNVPLDALADRTAFLQQATGFYKWRLDQSETNIGFLNHADSFAGGTWANLNISSTNTRTAFTGTGGGGAPLPWNVSNDGINGDVIELQLDFTVTWGGSTSPANGLYLFFEVAFQSPGASITSYSLVPGSAKFLLPASPSTSQYHPMTLSGWIPGDQGLTHIDGQASFLRISGLVPTGDGTGSLNVFSDWFLWCKHWRRTGIPIGM